MAPVKCEKKMSRDKNTGLRLGENIESFCIALKNIMIHEINNHDPAGQALISPHRRGIWP
jgi:hypothetical protein